jgi:hypothetical protein
MDRFGPRGLWLQACETALLKGMERVAHGLRCTAQVAGNNRRTLASMGSQQDLAPAQGKGIRRAQSSFYSCLLGWT